MSGHKDGSQNHRHLFTLEKAMQEIKDWQNKNRIIKYYDDSHYLKLKHFKSCQPNEEADHEELAKLHMVIGEERNSPVGSTNTFLDDDL